jgi:hypothetical protein
MRFLAFILSLPIGLQMMAPPSFAATPSSKIEVSREHPDLRAHRQQIETNPAAAEVLKKADCAEKTQIPHLIGYLGSLGLVLVGSLGHHPFLGAAGVIGLGGFMTGMQLASEYESRAWLKAASLYNGEDGSTYQSWFDDRLKNRVRLGFSISNFFLFFPYQAEVSGDYFFRPHLGIHAGYGVNHRSGTHRYAGPETDTNYWKAGLSIRSVMPFPYWLSRNGVDEYTRIGVYRPTRRLSSDASGLGFYSEFESYFQKSPHFAIGIPIQFMYGPAPFLLATDRQDGNEFAVSFGLRLSFL